MHLVGFTIEIGGFCLSAIMSGMARFVYTFSYFEAVSFLCRVALQVCVCVCDDVFDVFVLYCSVGGCADARIRYGAHVWAPRP